MKGFHFNSVVGFLLLLFAQVSIAQTDFQLTVSPSGNPIPLPVGGGQSVLTYTITNAGPIDEGDQTTVTFFLDPQIEPVSASSVDQNWSCFQVTGQITCDYTNIFLAGFSSEINLFLTTPVNPVTINSAVNADITNALGDPNPANDNIISDIDFILAGGVNLGLVKTITTGFPNTVAPGGAISFDLTVTNLTGPDATNVVVMDDILVNNLQFDAINSSPECVDVSSFVECTLSLLPSGDSVTLTLATTVDTFAQPGNKINTADVSANEIDPDLSNNSSDQPFTVVVGGSPEIEVTKTIVGGLTQVVQGGMIDYLIEVNNTGVGNALNVDLTDVLPIGVTYDSHVELGPNFLCNYSAPTLSCNAPSLPNTVSQDGVRISVVVDGAINLAVSNTATSTYLDSNSLDNTDTALFNIIAPEADLDLTMDTNPAGQINYDVGDLINLELTLQNPFASTGAPPNTTVTTTLLNETVFSSAQVTNVPGWLCTHDGSPTGGDVTCDSQGNPVAIGSNVLIAITAVADSPTATMTTTSAAVVSDFDSNPSNDTANINFNIIAASANLSLVFTSSPGVYQQGDSIAYTVQLENPLLIPRAKKSNIKAAPADTLVTFTLPTEVAFDNADVSGAPGWICVHDNSITGGLVNCDRGGSPFLEGSLDDITINVIATLPATNALVQAAIDSAADPDPSNNTGSQSDVINGIAPTTVTATKTASVAGVAVTDISYGQAFEYVLEVLNTGASNALNVVITDTLPADVTLVNIQSNGWSCGGANTRVGVGTADVDCLLDNALAPGSAAQIVVNVVATTNTSVNSISNTMAVNADNIGAEVTSTLVLLLQNPQATLTLSQSPSPVDPEADAVFSLLTTNTGNIDLNNVQIISQLPTGFTYNGFSGDAPWNCTENAGTVSCTYAGTLATAATTNLNIDTTAPLPQVNQSYALNATLSATELTVNLNQSLTVAFSTSDVSLIMTSVPPQVAQGEPFKHAVQITNSGNFDLVNVAAYYAVPQAATLLGVTGSDFSCAVSLNIVSCNNLQPLTAGNNTQLEISLRVDDFAGVVAGSVNVSADGINKIASTSTQIINNFAHDLALSKTASVSGIGQNELFTYQFDVNNFGSAAQTTFTLTDQLPDGVVFQTASGNGWNCDGNSQLNCQFNGSLPAGGQTQLLVDVIAPNEIGSITNTATVNLSTDENPSNNTSAVTVNVLDGQGGGLARADLGVVVEANNPGVLNTELVSWRIDVSNAGPDAANNVRVSNNLPLGFVAENVQVSNGAECTLLESSLMCDIATLAVNQSIEINLEGGFTNGFSGLVLNTVEVQSDAIDDNPTNNTSTAEVTVTAVQSLNADVSLELLANNQQVQQGGAIELAFIARNSGPNRAVNAQISGNLSGLIENVQLLNSGGWMCQVNNSGIACDFPGDFQVGMQSEISFSVQTQQVVQQSQPITFNATISSDSMDDQPGNNIIGFTNEVSRTPTEDEIFAIFQNAVGSAASETVIQSIRNVSSYCARSYFMAIEGLCEEFIAGATPENGADIINAMEELTPNEVAAQSNSAAEIITSQFRNVGSRLAQLRGGGGAGLNVAGLTARYGNESIPLGMLAYLNQSEDEPAVSNINDFVSPWGFFVNGSISMGERDATGQELGFDFDTYGLTAGVDYRFSPTKVAGVALGYANFDSEIEGEAEMKSTSFTLTGYGSIYIKDNLYIDGRISYGNPDFEQKRRINFAVDEIVIDRVATGKTNSNQYSVAMSAGYHFNKNSWNITPNASVQYVRTSIDAFQESGAGGFNFAFGEQEVKSMVWSVGTSVSKAISLKNGIISPQFDINFSRETENDGGLLEARFIEAPDDEIFWIGTDEPDRTFGSAGIGLVFIGANGKQAYINYRSIFGLEGFTRGTINVGARFEF